ncbi:hypothetical protein BH09VER1_BH09VER1_54830 [soil metagenome]
MASIYYRGTPPAGSWWVQLYHPRDGKPIRESLETTDPARAKLLCRRIELEAELAQPEYTLLEVPSAVLERLGKAPQSPPSTSGSLLALSPSDHSASPDQSPAQPTPPAESPLPPAPPPAAEKLGGSTIEQALAVYLAHITLENDDHHIEGKKSMLRKLFGPQFLPYKKTPPAGKAIQEGDRTR